MGQRRVCAGLEMGDVKERVSGMKSRVRIGGGAIL